MEKLTKKCRYMAQILNSVCNSTYHHIGLNREMMKIKNIWHYVVWSEDGEMDSFHANDEKQEQVLEFAVDFYTLEEFDEMVDELQEAFNRRRMSWILSSIQYEEDTELTHYSWMVRF